ncbi:MAG: hypothetical protein WCO68_00535 [Verrucomicrobiota bacterium]
MKTSASPIKSAADEIEALRRLFRATVKHYAAAVETDLNLLHKGISSQKSAGEKVKIEPELIRDARDMVTLMRTLEVKPEKGRRRDLKKIEGVIEDLQKIVAKW